MLLSSVVILLYSGGTKLLITRRLLCVVKSASHWRVRSHGMALSVLPVTHELCPTTIKFHAHSSLVSSQSKLAPRRQERSQV